MQTGNLTDQFGLSSEQWRPRIVAAANGQELRIVKVQGTFPWHPQQDADELFLVWRGRFRVEFRGRTVEMGPGDFLVVPRGVEHRTAADEAEILIFEPAGTLNTGNVTDEAFTAPRDVTV